MKKHTYRSEVRVFWCEDIQSFAAAAVDLGGFLGIGSTYTEAVSDLELGMNLEAEARRKKSQNAS